MVVRYVWSFGMFGRLVCLVVKYVWSLGMLGRLVCLVVRIGLPLDFALGHRSLVTSRAAL